MTELEIPIPTRKQVEDDLAALRIENDLQRAQLRFAWGKLGCRCIFDDNDNKTHEDAHCPIHGVYVLSDDEVPDVVALQAENERLTAAQPAAKEPEA